MNATAPSSPTKKGNKLDPIAAKRLIRFVEGLNSEKELEVFKDKLNERFNLAKRPRNKLPSLATSLDATNF